MGLFGMRAYPTPILRPLWPFFTAGVMVFFGVNSLQNSMLASAEFKNDPKNPYCELD